MLVAEFVVVTRDSPRQPHDDLSLHAHHVSPVRHGHHVSPGHRCVSYITVPPVHATTPISNHSDRYPSIPQAPNKAVNIPTRIVGRCAEQIVAVDKDEDVAIP